jgi:hypothetical protein
MSSRKKRRFEQHRLFVINDPCAPRLSPDLALEMEKMGIGGLHSSILFLQTEFWMATEGRHQDGQMWINRSVRDIQAVLKFMSVGSIHKCIKKMAAANLFTLRKLDEGDDTEWLTINLQEASKLKSIVVQVYVPPAGSSPDPDTGNTDSGGTNAGSTNAGDAENTDGAAVGVAAEGSAPTCSPSEQDVSGDIRSPSEQPLCSPNEHGFSPSEQPCSLGEQYRSPSEQPHCIGTGARVFKSREGTKSTEREYAPSPSTPPVSTPSSAPVVPVETTASAPTASVPHEEMWDMNGGEDDRFYTEHFFAYCDLCGLDPELLKLDRRERINIAGYANALKAKGFTADDFRTAKDDWALPAPPSPLQAMKAVQTSKNKKDVTHAPRAYRRTPEPTRFPEGVHVADPHFVGANSAAQSTSSTGIAAPVPSPQGGAHHGARPNNFRPTGATATGTVSGSPA